MFDYFIFFVVYCEELCVQIEMCWLKVIFVCICVGVMFVIFVGLCLGVVGVLVLKCVLEFVCVIEIERLV